LSFDYKEVSLVYPGEDYLQYVFDERELRKLCNFFESYDCIVHVDDNTGLTADAIRLTFKYDTPNETIEEICNKAIEMMWDTYQPVNVYGCTYYYENGKATECDEGFGFMNENKNIIWYNGYSPRNDEFHLTEVYEYDCDFGRYGKEITDYV
jgi:hypothetical protein